MLLKMINQRTCPDLGRFNTAMWEPTPSENSFNFELFID